MKSKDIVPLIALFVIMTAAVFIGTTAADVSYYFWIDMIDPYEPIELPTLDCDW